jgi:hypothetical protein
VRALLVELEENLSLILDMQRRTQVDRLEYSLPARLKRLVWQAQLPLIAGSLDDAALSAVIQAYRSSDFSCGLIRRPDDTYAIDAHQNNEIIDKRELFDQAIAAIRRTAGSPVKNEVLRSLAVHAPKISDSVSTQASFVVD